MLLTKAFLKILYNDPMDIPKNCLNLDWSAFLNIFLPFLQHFVFKLFSFLNFEGFIYFETSFTKIFRLNRKLDKFIDNRPQTKHSVIKKRIRFSKATS